MKGLLRKDLYSFIQTNSPRVLLLMLAFIVFWCWWSRSIGYASTMVALIIMMQVITTFTFDEKTTWLAYALASPVKRGDIALEKYVYTLANMMACLVFVGLSATAHILLFDPATLYQTVGMGSFVILGFGFSLFVCIPLFFRYGVEKMRVVSMLAFFVPFGGLLLATSIFGEGVMARLMSPLVLAPAAAVLAVTGVISHRISKSIVESLEP